MTQLPRYSVTADWLLNYQILRLVNQCRRLIANEFGKKLHLDDVDLREQLAAYAGNSRSSTLQRVYAELRLALIELEGPDPQPEEIPEKKDSGKPRRMYRGRPVAEPASAMEAPEKAEPLEDDNPGASDKKRVVIYRGRKMEL